MSIAFDTLHCVETLQAAGMPESQAKAQAKALSEILQENPDQLATGQDLLDLVQRLTIRFGKMLAWSTGIAIAAITALTKII